MTKAFWFLKDSLSFRKLFGRHELGCQASNTVSNIHLF